MKVHCFFEQSGTFKKEFVKLGCEAYDYDIQNEFGQTDFVIDLFHEIEGGVRWGAEYIRQHQTGGFDNGILPLHIF